jgi:hypothetical protein
VGEAHIISNDVAGRDLSMIFNEYLRVSSNDLAVPGIINIIIIIYHGISTNFSSFGPSLGLEDGRAKHITNLQGMEF